MNILIRKNSHKMTIGDDILIHGVLETKILEIKDEKIYFYDENRVKWYVDINNVNEYKINALV